MNELIQKVAEEGIVVLKNQHMSDEEFYQKNLTWGKHQASGIHACHEDYPIIFRVTNKKLPNGKQGLFSRGFLDWHCNNMFCVDTEEVVCLWGKKVIKDAPTIWAHCTNMYRDLPETLKKELDDVWVTMSNIHNIKDGGRIYTGAGDLDMEDVIKLDKWNFRTREGLEAGLFDSNFSAKQLKSGRYLIKVKKKLVRIHPVTREKVLYFPFGHMSDFPHKDELVERLMQPQYIYTHEWEEGDIVFSDQLMTIHKRDATLDTEEKRELYRTTFYYDA